VRWQYRGSRLSGFTSRQEERHDRSHRRHGQQLRSQQTLLHRRARAHRLPTDHGSARELTGHGDAAGFGEPPKPDFWIGAGTPNVPPIHIAFRVTNRALVDAFYKAAIAAGGKDNGAPGLRPHYHPNYYGAFVLDRTVTTSRRFATR